MDPRDGGPQPGTLDTAFYNHDGRAWQERRGLARTSVICIRPDRGLGHTWRTRGGSMVFEVDSSELRFLEAIGWRRHLWADAPTEDCQ